MKYGSGAANVWATITASKRKTETFLIGIDGCGGSGKSTFAEELRRQSPETVTVIHMDDFYKPSEQRGTAGGNEAEAGGNFDWRRLLAQVIEPLRRNETSRYQRYDWETDRLAEWREVPPGGIVIVEGVTSLRRELRDYYDYTVWVDTPRTVRLQRGIERDGERQRVVWEEQWMPAEDRYVAEHRPGEYASVVIEGETKSPGGRSGRFPLLLAAAIVSALTFPLILALLLSELVSFSSMYLFLLIFGAPAFVVGGTLVSYFLEAWKDQVPKVGSRARYAVSLAAYAAGGAAVMVLYISFVLRRLEVNPFDYLVWVGAAAGLYHYHVLLLLRKVRESI
ncbi:uridine kinase family protein [Paenibacillus thermotolerans]|uniref:uridine kinase family protein n=1 Tax=Paenibacillus thermotolerans TaxID=3027807 RepID=UPI002368C382|nr:MULTISPECIES: hypothetical protein [unclassified Paenibacillus]